MRRSRSTAHRKLRRPYEVHLRAEVHEAALAPSVAMLRNADAPQAQQAASIAGLQRVAGNRAVERALAQREPVTAQSGVHALLQRQQPPTRQQRTSRFHQRVFVVRDPEIGLGGRMVADLSAFKGQVMRLRNAGPWTLVLAIHGSENRVAAQDADAPQNNAIFYGAAEIGALFAGDAAWVAWRDQFGPNHLALVSCQVSAPFERVLIENLTRNAAGSGSQSPGATQGAQGLGTGCKPNAYARSWVPDGDAPIKTRQQFRRLSQANREAMLEELRSLNRTYGYYGAPPVPDDQILDYYFDETPQGEWAIVTIWKKQPDGSLKDTDIPFWNRSSGPRRLDFHLSCDQGVGQLRSR